MYNVYTASRLQQDTTTFQVLYQARLAQLPPMLHQCRTRQERLRSASHHREFKLAWHFVCVKAIGLRLENTRVRTHVRNQQPDSYVYNVVESWHFWRYDPMNRKLDNKTSMPKWTRSALVFHGLLTYGEIKPVLLARRGHKLAPDDY